MRTRNPLLSDYGSLLKQKALIIDKITKALEKKVQSQESTPEASISDLSKSVWEYGGIKHDN